MDQINQKTPIARIVMLGDFPICVAKDGTIIVALQWDYAAWTSGAAGFANEVQKVAGKSGQSAHISVDLSGESLPAFTRGIGKARNDCPGSARSRSAQVITTRDQRP